MILLFPLLLLNPEGVVGLRRGGERSIGECFFVFELDQCEHYGHKSSMWS